MGHEIEDDVDAHGIGEALGKLMKIPFALAFALPAVAVVGIAADDDHHAAFVVEDAVVMRALAAFFPELALQGGADAGHLRDFLQVEDGVKNRMVQRELDRLAVGENELHVLVDVFPLGRAPEIVEHEGSAVEQPGPQNGGFLFVQMHESGLDDVGERVVRELGIVDVERAGVRIDLQRGELMQAKGKFKSLSGESVYQMG